MDTLSFAVLAFLILGFGLISGRIQKTIITPSMVFVVCGLVLSGPVLGVIRIDAKSEFISTLAELTLVLVLFTDASRIDLKLLRREHNLPIRLLALGLPLTVLAGGLLASAVFPSFTFWQAMVLAIILAPTDAALGQAVVSSDRVPVRIRQALNIESGLNDGIALPVLLFFLSLAAAAEQRESIQFWIWFAAMQIILGPIVGIAVGYFGGKLVVLASQNGWITHSFQDLAALGLCVLSFAGAELVGGNGLIAAFCAGLTLGNSSRSICTCLYEFAEAEGQLLALLTFLIYGAVMVLPVFDHFNVLMLVYGFLSLTVVRIVPVAISLIGLRLQPDTILFLGWFGPRGIASILYGLLVLREISIVGRDEIFSITILTVLMSVFAHGLSAWPGANWYAARAEEMRGEPNVAELVPVAEMPVRLPYT